MGCSYVIILNRVLMLYIGDVKKQREGEKLKGSRLQGRRIYIDKRLKSIMFCKIKR